VLGTMRASRTTQLRGGQTASWASYAGSGTAGPICRSRACTSAGRFAAQILDGLAVAERN
jgi:hypothetical protein